MDYRNANVEDISLVSKLQQKYHINYISKEDKVDGFVTTLFSENQLKKLIEEENGLFIACDGDEIIGYAMAASWDYWSEWPLFQHMIKDLQYTEYMGKTLSLENSYQYGPIAIHRDYRGSDVFPNLFEFCRIEMNKKYPILITFINKMNPRSFKAHQKLGLDIIKEFEFNNNQYYELGYDTSKSIKEFL